MICILKFVSTLFSIWLFILKIGNTADWSNIEEWLMEEPNSCEERMLTVDIDTNAQVTCNNTIEIESKNENQSRKRARTKAENAHINYKRYMPHSANLSPEKIRLILDREKELSSRPEMFHEWIEFNDYPLEDNKEIWDGFCVRLWPNIEGIDERIGTKTCSSKFLKLHSRGGKYYKIYSADPYREKCFFADLLSCECKYGRGATLRAYPGTERYFFALKLSKDEYFLVTRLKSVSRIDDPTQIENSKIVQQGTKVNKEPPIYYKLRIVDFVKLS